MSEKKLFVLLAVAFFFLLLFLIALFLFKPLYVQSIPAEVTLDHNIGFKLDNDKFYFGRVKPGASAARNFIFQAPFDAVLVISSSGPAGDWIVPNKNNFLLAKGEEYPLELVMHPPRFALYGNYTADVHFTLYKPVTTHFFARS